MLQTKNDLIKALKNTLSENDGELAYFGDPVTLLPRKKESASVESVSSSKADQLKALKDIRIGDCQLCPLAATRNKLVFGTGNPESQVMFVGEGPGFDEDHMGDPFVGKAGQLLDKILAAINLDRTKVYIANIVKCHPMVDASQPEKRGNDRPPNDEEMAQCLPFLLEQIKIIQPKYLVTLGGTATKALLETKDGITKLRGQLIKKYFFEDAPSVTILPTYHPAALLRDAELKKPVWEDMKLLRSLLTAS